MERKHFLRPQDVRGGGVVPYEAHNLEAPVRIGPPHHIKSSESRRSSVVRAGPS